MKYKNNQKSNKGNVYKNINRKIAKKKRNHKENMNEYYANIQPPTEIK